MIYPIRAYGDPVLRKKCEDIDADYPELKNVIQDMFETMYNAHGVGLAAPQVGLPIRLFIVDCTVFAEDEEYAAIKDELSEFRQVFINARIVEESGDEWKFNEGCLSIPGIREDVSRQPVITIDYLDENFQPQRQTFSDIRARVIQHEYDHIEGILFTDYLSNFKKKLLKRKLQNITSGKANADYPMRTP
ncbi:MAG: peptide deformylase [Weeksellaceae bacterium]|nr:peptide deformylase [Weeksellaceae bacterium]